MNLILILPEEISPDGCVRLTDQRAGHIRSVLHAVPGNPLRIGRLNGPYGTGTVEKISDRSVTLSCVWEQRVPVRPPIDLLLAMPRPKVLKRLWAQLAALGVGRIILTNAQKVERYYFDTHILDSAFYTQRLMEGLQQARDTVLPEVTVVKRLNPFLKEERFPMVGKKLLADPSGTRTVFQCLEKSDAKTSMCFPPPADRVLVVVGPEGGWTPYELDLFRSHGFEAFGMGARILRTDTACIGLICLLSDWFLERAEAGCVQGDNPVCIDGTNPRTGLW